MLIDFSKRTRIFGNHKLEQRINNIGQREDTHIYMEEITCPVLRYTLV